MLTGYKTHIVGVLKILLGLLTSFGILSPEVAGPEVQADIITKVSALIEHVIGAFIILSGFGTIFQRFAQARTEKKAEVAASNASIAVRNTSAKGFATVTLLLILIGCFICMFCTACSVIEERKTVPASYFQPAACLPAPRAF